MHKAKKRTLRRVNTLTNKIAREYKKKNPNRTKIANWAEMAARGLKKVKRKK